jgi:hypothetical protein
MGSSWGTPKFSGSLGHHSPCQNGCLGCTPFSDELKLKALSLNWRTHTGIRLFISERFHTLVWGSSVAFGEAIRLIQRMESFVIWERSMAMNIQILMLHDYLFSFEVTTPSTWLSKQILVSVHHHNRFSCPNLSAIRIRLQIRTSCMFCIFCIAWSMGCRWQSSITIDHHISSCIIIHLQSQMQFTITFNIMYDHT